MIANTISNARNRRAQSSRGDSVANRVATLASGPMGRACPGGLESEWFAGSNPAPRMPTPREAHPQRVRGAG
jgi:hypothetical protein